MSSNPSPTRLSRLEKASIIRQLHQNLSVRAQKGPAEPVLDAFIPQLDAVASRLEEHVEGKTTAVAARVAHGTRVFAAGIEVDTYTRHVERFLVTEGQRPYGAFVAAVRALHAALFPDGLAFLDNRTPDENREIRRILLALQTPEYATIVAAIELPTVWLTRLQTAVTESESAYEDKALARGAQGGHVLLGKDAEAAWTDVVGRLRKYVESRTPAGDAEKELEAHTLLAPLLDALAHAKAVAASRATRRTKSKPKVTATNTTAAEPSTPA